MEVVLQGMRIHVKILRTNQQQGVACFQDDISWCLFNALTTSGDCCQHHVVVFLEGALSDGLAYQLTTEGDVGCSQLAVCVQFVHAIDMVVGAHQLVAHCHLDDLVNLARINQMVATHDGFVL